MNRTLRDPPGPVVALLIVVLALPLMVNLVAVRVYR
jgi:hypothetical protein